jgi:Gram-negative bacterial TonB protein C-terminal
MFRNLSVLLLLLVTSLCAQVSPNPAPDAADSNLQSFYVVGFGGEFTILDVQPSSHTASNVRFIRVYRACGTYHVRAEKHVFEDVSVAELVGGADLCASEKTFTAAVDAIKRKGVQEEWLDQYAIVAQCGSETRVHHLFWPEYLHFNTLEKKAPHIARFWSVPENIWRRYDPERGRQGLVDAVFGRASEWRHDSEQAAIDIRGGDFDLAVPDLPPGHQTEGKFKLSDLVPEAAEATGPEEDFGVVEDLDHLAVEKYEAIQYPPMARIAHIQGDVMLQISIDSATGSTTAVTALSGHPILARAATDAITKWVFLHPYLAPNPLLVKVNFTMHCPPTIETTTVVEKSRKKPRKKHRTKD